MKVGKMVGIDGMEQCIYLGHMVRNGTVRPENSTRGTEGFPDYEDKIGSEGISQLDWLLPEVHTKFCGDSSAIVRSHQEDRS